MGTQIGFGQRGLTCLPPGTLMSARYEADVPGVVAGIKLSWTRPPGSSLVDQFRRKIASGYSVPDHALAGGEATFVKSLDAVLMKYSVESEKSGLNEARSDLPESLSVTLENGSTLTLRLAPKLGEPKSGLRFPNPRAISGPDGVYLDDRMTRRGALGQPTDRRAFGDPDGPGCGPWSGKSPTHSKLEVEGASSTDVERVSVDPIPFTEEGGTVANPDVPSEMQDGRPKAEPGGESTSIFINPKHRETLREHSEAESRIRAKTRETLDRIGETAGDERTPLAGEGDTVTASEDRATGPTTFRSSDDGGPSREIIPGVPNGLVGAAVALVAFRFLS